MDTEEITKQSLKAHNANKDITFNEIYNKTHKLGNYNERMILQKIAGEKYGYKYHALTEENVNNYINYFDAGRPKLHQIVNQRKEKRKK
jgi:hypothetical protein